MTVRPFFPPDDCPPEAADPALTLAEFMKATGEDDIDRAERLMAVASALVEEYAPRAPDVIAAEAVIRYGGYLAQSTLGRSDGNPLGKSPPNIR